MDKQIGKTVLNQREIQVGVERVAALINKQFSDVVIITVVPGGILFTADVVRQLTIDVRMDTISCPHRPGERENRSEIIYHQTIPIDGADVIVVDDAIESGGTMKRLIDHLSSDYRPNSLAVATLLVKPGRIHIPAPQFYGYEMESDDLLIGYGLPWQEKYRNLPTVSKLKR